MTTEEQQDGPSARFGPHAPAVRAYEDPLDRDRADDESVAITRRGLARLALVATETASRFQREGVALDPMAWMLAPRAMFEGRSALDACVGRDECMRAVLLHGLSLGFDAEPALFADLPSWADEGVEGRAKTTPRSSRYARSRGASARRGRADVGKPAFA